MRMFGLWSRAEESPASTLFGTLSSYSDGLCRASAALLR